MSSISSVMCVNSFIHFDALFYGLARHLNHNKSRLSIVSFVVEVKNFWR